MNKINFDHKNQAYYHLGIGKLLVEVDDLQLRIESPRRGLQGGGVMNHGQDPPLLRHVGDHGQGSEPVDELAQRSLHHLFSKHVVRNVFGIKSSVKN